MKDVWFTACPGIELLDVAGPWEVLQYANELAGRMLYRTTLVTPGGATLPTRHGLRFAAAHPLVSSRPLPHTIIVTGATPTDPLPAAEQTLARWLRTHKKDLARVVSVCTGAFVLGEAGLLDGRRATTHWYFMDEFVRRFPKVRADPDAIYVRDGKTWTSAGITTGIDLALTLVEQDAGHKLALAVARMLVLFLHRSGGQAQFSENLRRQTTESRPLRDLHAFVLAHIDEPLPVERLAEEVSMSLRTFTRWFPNVGGESPARFVKALRIEEAKRLLTETDHSLAEIASRSGLGDESSLWRAFARQIGSSPAEYRRRFQAAARAS